MNRRGLTKPFAMTTDQTPVLWAILALNLLVVSARRFRSLTMRLAWLGLATGCLPLLAYQQGRGLSNASLGSAALCWKGLMIPWILHRAARGRCIPPTVRREHSLMYGIVATAGAVFVAQSLAAPAAGGNVGDRGSPLALTASLATLSCGLILHARQSPVERAVGLIVAAHGVAISTATLAWHESPLLELSFAIDGVGTLLAALALRNEPSVATSQPDRTCEVHSL